MKVIRQLRNEENPALGLFAKNPDEDYKLLYHVTNGSKHPSQYISSTDNVEVLFKYQHSGYRRWCVIDTDKIGDNCQFIYHDDVDVSHWHYMGKKLWNARQESVFVGHIPAEACTMIIDDLNGLKSELTDAEATELAIKALKENVMEKIIKSLASIAVDAMYNTLSFEKWENGKKLILEHDSAINDKNLRVALLVTYGIIESEAMPSKDNHAAADISEDIMQLIGNFDDPQIEDWFSKYMDEEIHKR